MARAPSAGKAFAVIIAVVLAAAATFAIFTYIRGIEQRAFEDAEPVAVLLAETTIAEGTPAQAARDAGSIVTGERPRANVPPGAVTDIDELAGLVTIDRILTDEVIVRDRWGDPAELLSDLDIPDGLEALSIQVDVPPGVAAFVRSGDQVSLLATVSEPPTIEVAEDGTEVEDPGEIRTQYLLQGIDVLAVGRRIVTEEGEDGIQQPAEQVLLTVALEPEDVERAVFAIENALLYFTLLPEDAEPQGTPGRTFADLFD